MGIFLFVCIIWAVIGMPILHEFNFSGKSVNTKFTVAAFFTLGPVGFILGLVIFGLYYIFHGSDE